MTTTQSYRIEKLDYCKPSHVLRWIIRNGGGYAEIGIDVEDVLVCNKQLQIPPHHFAASVVSRFMDQLSKPELQSVISWNDGLLYFSYSILDFKVPFNPFEHMTNADGTPRTSCTREELEQWIKEMEG